MITEHEHELEPSLIRRGLSLRDFYRGEVSLGEVWRRFTAAPYDAPIWAALKKMSEEQAERDRLASLDDTLALVDPRWADRDNLNRAALAAATAKEG